MSKVTCAKSIAIEKSSCEIEINEKNGRLEKRHA